MRTSHFRHWLPILTFCPVNNLPDLIYITVAFYEKEAMPVLDLYKVRKAIRKAVSGKKMFMEDVAKLIQGMYPNAAKITVALAFNRHVVELTDYEPF